MFFYNGFLQSAISLHYASQNKRAGVSLRDTVGIGLINTASFAEPSKIPALPFLSLLLWKHLHFDGLNNLMTACKSGHLWLLVWLRLSLKMHTWLWSIVDACFHKNKWINLKKNNNNSVVQVLFYCLLKTFFFIYRNKDVTKMLQKYIKQ